MFFYFDVIWVFGWIMYRVIVLDVGVEEYFFEDKLDVLFVILCLLYYLF